MTSITAGVQLGLASSSCKVLNAAAKKGRTSAPPSAVCVCPAPSRHCCSEFHGAGVHSSISSAVFNLERSLAKGLATTRSVRRDQGLAVRGLFGLGVPELAVIAGVAALLFGPKKLPEIGKSLGKTVKSFQQAAKEFESEVKAAAAVDETPAETKKPEAPVTPVSAPPPPPSTTTSASSEKDTVFCLTDLPCLALSCSQARNLGTQQ